VVEEAHNVFSRDTGQATSEDKRRTVQSFCNLLAEIRSFGEGVIVADQSPSKLAPDAIRNTNVQIAHALRDKEDREAVARAMIMTEEQEGFLGKLRTGVAGLFATGFERAAFVDMAKPPPETWGIPGFVSEGQLGDQFRTAVSPWWPAAARCVGCEAAGHQYSCGVASRVWTTAEPDRISAATEQFHSILDAWLDEDVDGSADGSDREHELFSAVDRVASACMRAGAVANLAAADVVRQRLGLCVLSVAFAALDRRRERSNCERLRERFFGRLAPQKWPACFKSR
jgi:hypothetical protein